jgi:hypothetical protein
MLDHTAPGIVGVNLEFFHIGHDIIVQVVDILEQNGNHAQRCENNDGAAGRCQTNKELGTHC